jgi:hypothetical protein
MSHDGEYQYLAEQNESTMVRDVSDSHADQTHLLPPAPPAIVTPMKIFPLESPPSSAKHFHHMDTQSKRMDRQAELEELRNKGLAKNLRKDLDHADALLMTGDDFFQEQQQLQRKWKEQQQASIAELHKYRGQKVEPAQVTKKFQSPVQQHRHTTSGSTAAGLSEMDNFFHQQRKLNNNWKKQQQDSMLYLHTYRGGAPVADGKPVVVSPTAVDTVESKRGRPGSVICNILVRQVSLVEAISIPLPESPVNERHTSRTMLPRMDFGDDSDMRPTLVTDDCDWKHSVAASEVTTTATLLSIVNGDSESMAVIMHDRPREEDTTTREVVGIECEAAEVKTELFVRANDGGDIQVDATDAANKEQHDQVDYTKLPHVEGDIPSETDTLAIAQTIFSMTNADKFAGMYHELQRGNLSVDSVGATDDGFNGDGCHRSDLIVDLTQSTNEYKGEPGKWCGDVMREGEGVVTSELLENSIDIDEENDGLPVVCNDTTCTGSTRIDKVGHDTRDAIASAHILAHVASEIDHISGITIPASIEVIAADSFVAHEKPVPTLPKGSKLAALSSREKPINPKSKWSAISQVKPNCRVVSTLTMNSNRISRAPLVVKRTPTLICQPRSVSPKKVIPLYKRPSIQQAVTLDSPICNQKWIPCLHNSRAGCERCLYHASAEEKIKFETEGRHYLIFLTKGGCSDCNMFPRNRDEKPARLCRKCFYDTHRLGKR